MYMNNEIILMQRFHYFVIIHYNKENIAVCTCTIRNDPLSGDILKRIDGIRLGYFEKAVENRFPLRT